MSTSNTRQIQMDEQSMDSSEASVESTPIDLHSQGANRFIWWHWLLIVPAVIITLALAWWQYCRFNSISGTAQNLGYTLQWPFFGAFVVFGYFKYRALERQSTGVATQKESKSYSQSSYIAQIIRLSRLFHVSHRSSAGIAREIPQGILPLRIQNTSMPDSCFLPEISEKCQAENEYNAGLMSINCDALTAEEQEIFEYNHYLRSLAYLDDQEK